MVKPSVSGSITSKMARSIVWFSMQVRPPARRSTYIPGIRRFFQADLDEVRDLFFIVDDENGCVHL